MDGSDAVEVTAPRLPQEGCALVSKIMVSVEPGLRRP